MTRILLVDDREDLLLLMHRVLEREGYDCRSTTDVDQARNWIDDEPPHLIVCDLLMPQRSGMDLAREVTRRHPEVGIVMVTAVDDPVTAEEALALGVYGYLVKPVEANELLIAVANARTRRDLERAANRRAAELEQLVERRTAALLETINDYRDRVRSASLGFEELLYAVSGALEFGGESWSMHPYRVSRYCAAMAAALGVSESEADRMRIGAALHDAGHAALPQAILGKVGPLDPAEWAVVQRHCRVGHDILAGYQSASLRVGAEIALHHHERWDGSGYPAGLRGADIPLSARVVAVADVFDAMTSVRPHRPAHSVDDATEWILGNAGVLFCPDAVRAFERVHEELLRIRTKYPDGEPV